MTLLELLEAEKIDEFNSQRPRRSGPDLFAADLSGRKLVGADLTGANLEKADLSGADLSDCLLAKANLSGADLTGACLGGVVAVQSRWKEAWLEKVVLNDADFTGADLAGAVLKEATATGAVFRRSRMKEAEVTDADFSGADFAEVRAKGADFTGSNLRGSVFVDARLGGADFTRTQLSEADLSGVLAAGAVLAHSDMRNAKLLGADLTGSDFGGALLHGADFSKADLAEAAFTGATLEGTCMVDARLDEAGLTPDQLKGVELGEVETQPGGAPEVLNLAEVQGALCEGVVGLLWENDPGEGRLSLCTAVLGVKGLEEGGVSVLPVPMELVVARNLVAGPVGFFALALVERPSGVIAAITDLSPMGELGAQTNVALGYEPAVAPVVRADGDGFLIFGLDRDGPVLLIQRFDGAELIPVHGERVPTAKGFVGRETPLLVTKGGVLHLVEPEGLGPALSSPVGFPGRAAATLATPGELFVAWLPRGEKGLFWARIGETDKPVPRRLAGEKEVVGLDLAMHEGRPLALYNLAEEGEMGALALWGCYLEGGEPFPVLVDPAFDVEEFAVLSGEDTRVLCHTLSEELVVVSLQGTTSEISQRFP